MRELAGYEREMIGRRTRTAPAAAEARGRAMPACRPAGTPTAAPDPITPGGVARVEAASFAAWIASKLGEHASTAAHDGGGR